MIAYAPPSVLVRPPGTAAGRGDRRRRPCPRPGRRPGGGQPADRGAAAARPVPGPGGRLVRQPPGAVRPGQPGCRDHPHQPRVVPGRAGARRHDRGRRGRARLREHRQPRLLPRAGRRPAAHPQPAAGRQPRHRCLGPDQLPAPAALAPHPGDEEYDRRVAACGEQLNTARRHPGGGFVHGSDLYGTANAARDLADVLTALETGPVDLYGDSYGSYFGQTFAARYRGCCGR